MRHFQRTRHGEKATHEKRGKGGAGKCTTVANSALPSAWNVTIFESVLRRLGRGIAC